MITNIPAFWHNSPNFGDALTPWLIRKITGLDAIWTNDNRAPKYMVTGSILNDPIAETCIVWGAGIAHRDTYIRKPLEIRAVRGPRTRQAVMNSGIECPEVYGDPALLMPRFLPMGRNEKQSLELGIIPHIVDYNHVREKYWNNPNVTVIDLMGPIELAVGMMHLCKTLVSSSLHGIIVAHAYGLPCGWVKFSGKILGDNTKFHDYYESVGKFNEPGPLNLEENNPSIIEIIDWVHRLPQRDLDIDLEKLWDACPFKP
jgi:pyruvyltransferase